MPPKEFADLEGITLSSTAKPQRLPAALLGGSPKAGIFFPPAVSISASSKFCKMASLARSGREEQMMLHHLLNINIR